MRGHSSDVLLMAPPATAETPPPHAPELGWSQRLLGPFHVTGVFWHRFPYVGLALLPAWAMWLPVTLFTTAFFLVLRRIGAAIDANLAVVLGPAAWWRRQARVYQTMWEFAWCYAERFEHLRAPRRFKVAVEGAEHLPAKEGFIFVTAHLGHWGDGLPRRLHRAAPRGPRGPRGRAGPASPAVSPGAAGPARVTPATTRTSPPAIPAWP